MNLNVVRVTVPTGGVVRGEERGLLLDQQGGERARGLVEVGRRERHLARIARGPTVEPRVGVPEELDAGAAQRPGRRPGLGHPDLAEIPSTRRVRGDQAPFPRGGDDKHHPVALCGQTCHGARGEQSLIIGVGMEEDAT